MEGSPFLPLPEGMLIDRVEQTDSQLTVRENPFYVSKNTRFCSLDYRADRKMGIYWNTMERVLP